MTDQHISRNDLKINNQSSRPRDSIIENLNIATNGFASLPKDFVLRAHIDAAGGFNGEHPITVEQVLEIGQGQKPKQAENLGLMTNSLAKQLLNGDIAPDEAAQKLIEESKRQSLPINKLRELNSRINQPYLTSIETKKTFKVLEAIEDHQRRVEAEVKRQLQADRSFSEKSQEKNGLTASTFSRSLKSPWQQYIEYLTSVETGETFKVSEASEDHQRRVEAERKRQLKSDEDFSEKLEGNRSNEDKKEDKVSSNENSPAPSDQGVESLAPKVAELASSLWQRYINGGVNLPAYPTSLETGETFEVLKASEDHQRRVEAERKQQLQADQSFSKKPESNRSNKDKKEDKVSSNENSPASSDQQVESLAPKVAELASMHETGPSDGSKHHHQDHEHHEHGGHSPHIAPTRWFLSKGVYLNGLAERRSLIRSKLEDLAERHGREGLADLLGRNSRKSEFPSEDFEELPELLERMYESYKEAREQIFSVSGRKPKVLDVVKHMLGREIENFPAFLSSPDGTILPIADTKAAERGQEIMAERLANEFEEVQRLVHQLHPNLNKIRDLIYNNQLSKTDAGKEIESRINKHNKLQDKNFLQAYEHLIANRGREILTTTETKLVECSSNLSKAAGEYFDINATKELEREISRKNRVVYGTPLIKAASAIMIAVGIRAI